MQSHLKLLVKGFQVFEQRIIETTVRLSEARSPRLSLHPDATPLDVDIVIIDGSDPESMRWAKENSQLLAQRTVVWIDAKSPSSNPLHVDMARPILWVNLPIVLSRILDEQALEQSAEQVSNVSREMEKISRASPSLNGAKVLVVDDSKPVRDYLANILADNGYAVFSAETGEEAIEKAKEQFFDCVLMDVLMPGIDGYKACREIRRIKQYEKSIPVVMLTSRTSPFDKIRGKFAGCDAYLTKPVKIKTLLSVVKKKTGQGK